MLRGCIRQFVDQSKRGPEFLTAGSDKHHVRLNTGAVSSAVLGPSSSSIAASIPSLTILPSAHFKIDFLVSPITKPIL